MNSEIDWTLLAKYFAGECSVQEEAAIYAWLEADAARHELMDELRHVWKSAERRPHRWDVEAAWSKLDEQTRVEAKITPLRAAHAPSGTRTRQRRYAVSFLRVAAVIATVGLTTLLALQFVKDTPQAPPEPDTKAFVTKRGQRASIQLTDGTHVRLNVDSEITIPSAFAADKREVFLQGEAYFEVAEDVDRPFVVHAEHAVVQVLGTAFDVRAYPDDEQVQVIVAEGKVSLRAEEQPVDEGAVR